MATVSLKTIIQKMNLKNLTPEVDITGVRITKPDINRPAMQLAGFFDHFDSARVEIIGFVEYSYMEKMESQTKERIYNEFFSTF